MEGAQTARGARRLQSLLGWHGGSADSRVMERLLELRPELCDFCMPSSVLDHETNQQSPGSHSPCPTGPHRLLLCFLISWHASGTGQVKMMSPDDSCIRGLGRASTDSGSSPSWPPCPPLTHRPASAENKAGRSAPRYKSALGGNTQVSYARKSSLGCGCACGIGRQTGVPELGKSPGNLRQAWQEPCN